MNQEVLVLAEEELPSELKQEVISFRSMNPLRLIPSVVRLRKFLRANNFTIIHVHQANRLAFMVALLAPKKSKILLTAWGSDVLLAPKSNFLVRWMIRYTLNRSQIVTADAQIMLDAIQELTPKPQLRWIQYGIDLQSFTPWESKEDLIYSNRLHKKLYRIDRIVDYFAEFSKAYPTYKLIIGATGEQTKQLQEQVSSLGLNDRVEFVGWLDAETNMNYYHRAKYYISLPESDGTSVSLLEAMSQGCIPVVSDLPANREWVKDNGVIEGMNNPLMAVLELNPEIITPENRKLIEQTASREACHQQFLSYYRELGLDF